MLAARQGPASPPSAALPGSVALMVLLAGSTHYAAILEAGAAVVVAIVGAGWAIWRQIKAGRDEQARAMGQLAGLIGDWIDEVEEHLSDQDKVISHNADRLRQVEQASGLPPGPPYAPPRRRTAVRRIRAAEKGFDALDDESSAFGGSGRRAHGDRPG